MIRLVIIWAVALALAGVAATSALSNVLTKRAPEVATTFWPSNGFAYAQAAEAAMRSDQESQTLVVPILATPKALAFSRKAFLLEPTETKALRNIAVGLKNEDEIRARALLTATHSLYRRDTTASLLLIEYASTNEDNSEALGYFNELLLRETPVHGRLITILATILPQPGVVDDIRGMLSGDPVWRDQFWRQANQTAASIDRAADLRLLVAADGGSVDPDIDQMLIVALVDTKRFDKAHEIYRAIFSKPVGNAVTNGSFADEPIAPPFGWRLISSGDYGAGMNRASEYLSMSAIRGSGGLVAEQLLRLEPGDYRLSVGLEGPPKSNAKSAATVVCAVDDHEFATLPLTERANQIGFATDNCPYVWLRLSVFADDRNDGVDVIVENVAITRIRT